MSKIAAASAQGIPSSAASQRPSLWLGIALCIGVTLVAELIQLFEHRVFNAAWLEALVLAILVGATIRSLWTPPARFAPGIAFCAKTVLEVAVLLLGASISLQTIAAAGAPLLIGIASIVAVAVVVSFGIGRSLGLPWRMALLVAAGNSICGNSAIAAVAPVIGASSKDVASSIAFTAVLGVVVVLSLPLAAPLLGLTELQYGVLAGLTVYAVPQVLAATAPVGAVAVQVGTLVKLVRVLMLGPLVTILSVISARRPQTGAVRPRMSITQVVPWFIVGFLALALMRWAGLVPPAVLPWVSTVSGALTVVSMAALGLGVDVRSVARAGPAVTLTVILSLGLLLLVSLALIRVLGL